MNASHARTASRKKIGLALGAGAARGCAHLGVFRALRETGITVDYIAGTSIGSLMGAVYASGSEERLQESLLNMEWKEILSYFFEVSLPRSGLIDGKKIADFFAQYVEDVDVSELPVPYRSVATDVLTGDEVVLDEGPVFDAIRASISFPGIFTPVVRGAAVLVDGGLVNPVPVSVVREMGADLVIAVDINYDRVGRRHREEDRREAAAEPAQVENLPVREDASEWQHRMKATFERKWSSLDTKVKTQLKRWTDRDTAPNIFDVLGNTIRIMEAQIAETQLAVSRPEVLIRPDVGYISFLEFNHAGAAIKEGYETALPVLEDLAARL